MADLCARCHQPAIGYATIGHERYCHADERSCYTEQHRDENRQWLDEHATASTDDVLTIAARMAVRWHDALELLGRDHG